MKKLKELLENYDKKPERVPTGDELAEVVRMRERISEQKNMWGDVLQTVIYPVMESFMNELKDAGHRVSKKGLTNYTLAPRSGSNELKVSVFFDAFGKKCKVIFTATVGGIVNREAATLDTKDLKKADFEQLILNHLQPVFNFLPRS